MKKTISLTLTLFLMIIFLTGCTEVQTDKKGFKIVTSFYPMYTIASKLAENVEEVVVDNMASENVGCLHDYTLTTADLKKIENANVFVFNGLGIEKFISKILQTYPNIKVIDSSEKVARINYR